MMVDKLNLSKLLVHLDILIWGLRIHVDIFLRTFPEGGLT